MANPCKELEQREQKANEEYERTRAEADALRPPLALEPLNPQKVKPSRFYTVDEIRRMREVSDRARAAEKAWFDVVAELAECYQANDVSKEERGAYRRNKTG